MTTPHVKVAVTIGAILGSLVAFIFGTLPALAYGGYAGLLLAQGIGGPALLTRALVVFGMALGVAAVTSLFTILGAICGAAFGASWQLLRHAPTTSPSPQK